MERIYLNNAFGNVLLTNDLLLTHTTINYVPIDFNLMKGDCNYKEKENQTKHFVHIRLVKLIKERILHKRSQNVRSLYLK